MQAIMRQVYKKGEVYLQCHFPKCQNQLCKKIFCLKLPNLLRTSFKNFFFENDTFERKVDRLCLGTVFKIDYKKQSPQ